MPTLQRLTSSANNNAYAMVDLARSYNWTKVAVLYENGAHCQDWYTVGLSSCAMLHMNAMH